MLIGTNVNVAAELSSTRRPLFSTNDQFSAQGSHEVIEYSPIHRSLPSVGYVICTYRTSLLGIGYSVQKEEVSELRAGDQLLSGPFCYRRRELRTEGSTVMVENCPLGATLEPAV